MSLTINERSPFDIFLSVLGHVLTPKIVLVSALTKAGFTEETGGTKTADLSIHPMIVTSFVKKFDVEVTEGLAPTIGQKLEAWYNAEPSSWSMEPSTYELPFHDCVGRIVRPVRLRLASSVVAVPGSNPPVRSLKPWYGTPTTPPSAVAICGR